MKKLLKVALPVLLAAGLLFSCSNSSDSPEPSPATGDQTTDPGNGTTNPGDGTDTTPGETSNPGNETPGESSEGGSTDQQDQEAVTITPIFNSEDCTITVSELAIPNGNWKAQWISETTEFGSEVTDTTIDKLLAALSEEDQQAIASWINGYGNSDGYSRFVTDIEKEIDEITFNSEIINNTITIKSGTAKMKLTVTDDLHKRVLDKFYLVNNNFRLTWNNYEASYSGTLSTEDITEFQNYFNDPKSIIRYGTWTENVNKTKFYGFIDEVDHKEKLYLEKDTNNPIPVNLQYAVNLDPIFDKDDCQVLCDSIISLPDGNYTYQQWSTYSTWGITLSETDNETACESLTDAEISELESYKSFDSSTNKYHYSFPVVTGTGSFIYKFSLSNNNVSVSSGEGLNQFTVSDELIKKFIIASSKINSATISLTNAANSGNTFTYKTKFTSESFLVERIQNWLNDFSNFPVKKWGTSDPDVYTNADSSKYYYRRWDWGDSYKEDYYIEKN